MKRQAVSYSHANRQRSGLSLQGAWGQEAWVQSYAYDAGRRLTNIASGAGAFGYAYRAAQTRLPGSIRLPGGLQITNDYDGLARLAATWLKNAQGSNLNSHAFAYASATDRITQTTRTAGNTVAYSYDASGQLIGASGKEPGGADRPHERFGYGYDPAGNLVCRTNNGARASTVLNELNQFRSLDFSGNLTVAGMVSSAATNVTVDGQAAGLYADSTFALENAHWEAAQWNSYTAEARDALGRVATNAVRLWLPESDFLLYDANGNLRTNGSLVLEYDDENQLTRITEPAAWKSEFSYDGKMRRRARKEFVYLPSSSSYLQTNEVRYVYDGMLVLQERHYDPRISTNLPQRVVTYTRGRDLSGTLEGAGGIGGLLARTESGAQGLGAPLATAFYHGDNVGNISALAATNGQVVARYLYEPFGTIIAMGGPLAERNLYRFSSKEWHENSSLVYYGYRYYSPGLQRWINRDPIGEVGGRNLFGFSRNSALNTPDSFGLLVPGPLAVGVGCTATTTSTGAGTTVTVVCGAGASTAAGAVCSIVAGVVLGGGIIYVYVCNLDLICNQPVLYPAHMPGQRNCPPIRICSPKNQVTICHKTEDWWEADPNDPESGERLCKYNCNDGQTVIRHGPACDEDTITVPSY